MSAPAARAELELLGAIVLLAVAGFLCERAAANCRRIVDAERDTRNRHVEEVDELEQRIQELQRERNKAPGTE